MPDEPMTKAGRNRKVLPAFVFVLPAFVFLVIPALDGGGIERQRGD